MLCAHDMLVVQGELRSVVKHTTEVATQRNALEPTHR